MDIIQKAKSDPIAFGQLYELHMEALYQFVAFRVSTTNDAEEITSQIWEKAFHGIAQLKTTEDLGFKCWLYQIARNKIRDYYRQKAPLLSLDPEADIMDSFSDIQKNLQSSIEHEELKQLIQSLPKKQRETILLSLFSDFKNNEIAQLLHISEKTVASNLSRAIQFLRSHWKNLQ